MSFKLEQGTAGAAPGRPKQARGPSGDRSAYPTSEGLT